MIGNTYFISQNEYQRFKTRALLRDPAKFKQV
jgi:hypothetical protein